MSARAAVVKPTTPALVCGERCATCIFGADTPIDVATMRLLSGEWRATGGHQICHAYGIDVGDEGLDGTDVWCRGFYEARVPLPLRESFEAMGLIRVVGGDVPKLADE